MNRLGKSALSLWCVGLATLTFDLILTFDVRDFTIKIFYFFFAGAALLLALDLWREGKIRESLRELGTIPWVFALALAFYQLCRSPFSPLTLKSFAYSIWLLFDITAVAFTGSLLFRRVPRAYASVSHALSAVALFLVTVLLVDQMAYSHGYTTGLIGFNQDPSLMWGMSRVHAFSFEPSYISLYFTLALFHLLGAALDPPVPVRRGLVLPAIGALTMGIFMLGSRTGWLIALIGLSVILFKHRTLLKRRVVALGVSALVMVLAGASVALPSGHLNLMWNNLIATFFRGHDGSANVRIGAMKEGLRMMAETKGLGTGVGASLYHYLQQHPELELQHERYSQGGEVIMSVWSQIAAESGAPGLLLLLAFSVSAIYLVGRAAKRAGGIHRYVGFVSAILVLAVAAHLVGNVARTDIWAWMGLWMAYAKEKSSA